MLLLYRPLRKARRAAKRQIEVLIAALSPAKHLPVPGEAFCL